MWHYLHDPMFSRFDTILECAGHTHRRTDGRTDRQTHDDGIYCASRVKNATALQKMKNTRVQNVHLAYIHMHVKFTILLR